jgi:hypothetical protein
LIDVISDNQALFNSGSNIHCKKEVRGKGREIGFALKK